jgi:hypothetical protein
MAANRIAALGSCQEYSKKRFIRDSKRDWQIAKIAMIAKIAGIENQSLNHKGDPFDSPFASSGSLRAGCGTKRGLLKAPTSPESRVIGNAKTWPLINTDGHGFWLKSAIPAG